MDNLPNNTLVANLPEERGWEYKQITVTRVPGYGFGIAVSGGRDNPHFASGDPSIAVSDVLASGPAERILQVNDRIMSVNGISLQNVDYATAVQVLRDSGDTVVLVVKRRTAQYNHGHSASFTGPPLAALGINPLPPKVTLTKNSKKEDFGIVLGCKLFIKEISTKAREQLLNTNQVLAEGDFVTKINNTNCSDLMSLKEAKKIIDSTKDKLHLTVTRDSQVNSNISHQTQSSVSTTGAVNNFYKGDDFLTSGQSYSNQNLYVQPPTRNPNLNTNGFDDKLDTSGPNSLTEDKSNLAPRGRLRGPISDANLNQLDNRNNMGSYGRSKSRDEPPRPPPPRAEDYYSSRRQLYEEDPIVQKTKQPIPDARFITFHKEGSVGIRLTGGNFVGIFVTAVQPGSPASLQGLQPGDKILKVNDMDMTGVTREEAVLFLLSLQDRIELIVQFCKEEYDSIVASQKGDSFYIKTHFHYENPAKGEMTFRSGDIFHVIDTLYNGVVGCWQVYRIGRNNQEVQKGIIPNKARAEELATAQFNATKKEMSANESRGSFFRRRRSSNRRSKSLGKEHWDDILFSDTVSKFPAYERVVLKHPGYTRPVILFGPISDVAREKLLKDFPDKFISPQLDTSVDDSKTQKISSNIIRLSAIREVISTGKHALLDITPNAVERLNYAQLYPIVVFFKAETKIIIKQLRQGLPKSAHKSSKKLLEQCQKLDKVWSHIFSSTITLNDNTDNWYRKVREIIDKQQSGALWMSESKPQESLSDDFLFPMSSLRLSYASSPESDLEHSPGPPLSPGLSAAGLGGGGRLTKASSDPSVVMPDSSPTDILPPYQPSYDTRYGFNANHSSEQQTTPVNTLSPNKEATQISNQDIPGNADHQNVYTKGGLFAHNNGNYDKHEYPKIGDPRNEFAGDGRSDYNKNVSHKRQTSTLHGHFNHNKGHSMSEPPPNKDGTAPDLPPRVDRAVKPMGLLSTPTKSQNGRSAHERLFGTKANAQNEGSQENADPNFNNKVGSLERSQNSKSDSLSSYDSFNNPNSKNNPNARIIPNAHDDLKTTLSKIDPVNSNQVQNSPSKFGPKWDQNTHRHDRLGSRLDLKYGMQPNSNSDLNIDPSSPRNSREIIDKDVVGNMGNMEPPIHQRTSDRDRQDMYRYTRSPAKQGMPTKQHIETKTDYGKYRSLSYRDNKHNMQCLNSKIVHMSRFCAHHRVTSYYRPETLHYIRRNNSSAQDYTRTSHQDLTQSHFSIHQSMPQHHHSPMKSSLHHSNGFENGQINHMSPPNGQQNAYKPIPPPKPKNYKPPYKGQNSYGQVDGMMQPALPYQHGKSHSNPVDQRSPNMNTNYYYNMPQNTNNWHTETAVRYNSNIHGHYDMAPPYESRRHTSISYASRSEIAPISQHDSPYNMEGTDMLDNRPPERPNIVDLQGSREQRGSAFELYRKPVHHNLSLRGMDNVAFGSQPNIAHNPSPPPTTTTTNPKKNTKLTKTQSFKHQKTDGLSTPKFFRKFNFRGGNKSKETTPKVNKKLSVTPERIIEHRITTTPTRKIIGSPNHRIESPNHRIASPNHMIDSPNHRIDILNQRIDTSSQRMDSPNHRIDNPNLRIESIYNRIGTSPNHRSDLNHRSDMNHRLDLDHRSDMNHRSDNNKKSDVNHRSDMNHGSDTNHRSNSNHRTESIHRMDTITHRIDLPNQTVLENQIAQDLNRNPNYLQANSRDVTSAVIDSRGARLINEYWGVSLDVPPNAVPEGIRQEIYFVISDPRLCDNTPPLDLENGETMLSPLVMCGPQGIEFLKPVILNIPHYANTLPSLGISLKATDSESDVRTDWDNILLPSNHAANSVAVKVDHF